MPGVFVINPVGLAEVLRGPEGPVSRHMIELGERVKVTAIADLKPGFPRDFLGPYIVKRIIARGEGIGVQVGTEHTRTEPHVIQGNPLLVFDWPKAGLAGLVTAGGPATGGALTGPVRTGTTGGVVFLRRVNHPGSDFSRPTEKHPDGYIREVLLRALETVRLGP